MNNFNVFENVDHTSFKALESSPLRRCFSACAAKAQTPGDPYTIVYRIPPGLGTGQVLVSIHNSL